MKIWDMGLRDLRVRTVGVSAQGSWVWCKVSPATSYHNCDYIKNVVPWIVELQALFIALVRFLASVSQHCVALRL